MSPRTALAVAAPYLAFFLLPVAWLALTSLWPDQELARALPSRLTLASYRAALEGGGLARAIANSLVVGLSTTALSLVLAAPAAFAVARLEFPGRRLLLGVALAISMFPPIATVGPLYVGLRAVGLLDTLPGLVLPYASFSLPLALLLLTQAFRDLPVELYRAARALGVRRIRPRSHPAQRAVPCSGRNRSRPPRSGWNDRFAGISGKAGWPES